MKQNYKIKILVLGCFVFGLFSIGFLGKPLIAVAGNSCTQNLSYATCETNGGTWVDSVNTCDCPSGVKGDSCGGNYANCGSGLSCSLTTHQCGTSCKSGANCLSSEYCDSGGACILLSSSTGQTGGTTSGNPPTVPAPTPTPSGSSGCLDPSLTKVNGICVPLSGSKTGLAASTSLTGFILTLIQILLSFAGLIAVVMVILGGYWYMAAGGNEEMSEKGRKTMLNFVMGLAIIIMAYVIVTVVVSTLTGADKLSPQ